MKRFTSALILFLSCAMLFCSCHFTEQEKTFTAGEMSITLTDYFHEVSQQSYTAVYTSNDISVFATAQLFEGFEEDDLTADSTLEEYGALLLKTNEREDLEMQKKNGLTYYFYEAESKTSHVRYSYLTAIYKGEEAFWVIQFTCETDRYPDFEQMLFQYAASVTFATKES